LWFYVGRHGTACQKEPANEELKLTVCAAGGCKLDRE
jgi:hypothetical protein